MALGEDRRVLICASCGQENPDGAHFCNACAASLVAAEPGREVRKTVSVLFCDIAGSTALGESTDPEALRALLAVYFERMKGIVERHGGSVEKFIGDAVMAVFGVPVVHEDDALRACRAAIEMRDVLPELGIEGRIGVNTGTVVAGTEERLATGDAVNVAARLEQAAQPGEVLIGAPTLELVRPAVDVEQVEPLQLKGKAEPVTAYRLSAVTGGLTRRFTTPMVGRDRELRSLRDALARAVHDRSCQLFTVLGSAGVGKSRLAAEFLAGLDARVVRGHCLSYGEGITYWPVVGVLKQLGALSEDDAAAAPLRSLLGETSQAVAAEEIAWGFRKVLEQAAQDRPLVCVFDDIQWAEPTFLALVESLAELSHDAPVLLLCMARPELLELRPSWGGGMWNATTVLLEPLDAAETGQLLASLGDVNAELAGRIAAAAGGNPFFMEEMLALVGSSPDGPVEVPPTIHALLTTRLDQLDGAERAVLERGSVEGQIFHRGAVESMADGESQGERLTALVRKQLVRPDRPQVPHENAYRFRHLLIRDAAYDALPKSVRADLHRRFADWLERHGSELVELEEILGYHLEQAAQHLADLGRPDLKLAGEAAARLSAAGRRARARGDRRAAQSLLGRAVALGDSQDVPLLVDLARCLDDLAAAVRMLEDAALAANARGDLAGAALARAIAAEQLGWASKGSVEEQERLAQAALPLLEAAGDHAGLAALWFSLANGVYNIRCQYAQMEHAAEQGRRHALLAGLPPSHQGPLSIALVWGARPAEVALRRLDELTEGDPSPYLDLSRGILLAMSGEFEAALAFAETAEGHARELGVPATAGFAEIEALAGDLQAATARMGVYCEWLAERGLTAPIATYAAWRGRLLCKLGRYEEAERLARESRELGEEADPIVQAYWRQVAALVHASRGEHAEAERLAREAVARTELTDSPKAQGDALSDLGEVLEAAGRHDDATDAYRGALECYERKRIVPLMRRVRERLEALER
jgi:class 3 adenylate cyclase/tetratricopeptide (TPR) repeat protein